MSHGGYWVSTEVDGNATLMANTQNFWVAGKDAAAAAAYIAGLNSETAPYYYLYQGQVLGSVIENGTAYGIDPANSAVTLKFDFGNTKAIIPSGSSISFTSSAPTNPSWKLIPDAAVVSGGKFTGTLTNDGTIMTTSATGTIKGQFFGTQAQGIGGTLKAIAGGSTAIGVFKGTGEMTLP